MKDPDSLRVGARAEPRGGDRAAAPAGRDSQCGIGKERTATASSLFATGSGYGLCQGEVIPCCASITRLIGPNDSKAEFTLTGPAPLQSTKPVACGDICIYHHLDWYLGSGAVAVKGCQPNQSTCVVRVPLRLPRWTPVYVRQNGEDPILWAIWNSGHPAVDIKGTVDARECGDGCKLVPVDGATVTASGPNGGDTATTDKGGHYTITVPKGRGYTVTPRYKKLKFDPGKRKLDALSTVNGVDFRAHEQLVSVGGIVRKHECYYLYDTPETNKQCLLHVVPAVGQSVEITGEDGTTNDEQTDSDGRYHEWVTPGKYTVRIPGPAGTADPAKSAVDARRDVQNVNFALCKSPSVAPFGGTPENLLLPCDLVEIRGRVVDSHGVPYEGATILVFPGSAVEDYHYSNDFATIGANGDYDLFAGRGTDTLETYDDYVGSDDGQPLTVQATDDVNAADSIRLMPQVYAASTSPTLLLFQIHQWPHAPDLATLRLKITGVEVKVGSLGGCRATATVPVTGAQNYDHDATVTVKPDSGGSSYSSFCEGTYTVALINQVGDKLLSADFEIDSSSS